MKKVYLATLISFFGLNLLSQSATDCAVQISASVQTSPAQITLNWPGNATTTGYTVYRKLKNSASWGASIASLSGTVTQFVDASVATGTSYEYKIQRTGSGYTGYGYINAGIEIPVIENRGNLILMVDSSFVTSLSSEISRLIDDMEGDGWNVIRHDVLRTGSVTHVKSLIVSDYNSDPANTTALFILGHVPVPYSGNINPDGHPDHLGAWPTDAYYADVNGTWTDVSVTSTTASPARTQNVPGDGKFDQSVIPSAIELQTGRVDLSSLSSFSLTETQLLKNYLDKDHDYRKKNFTALTQGVVDDNFGYMSGEAFAASGYNNFSALLGNSNITANDYFTTLGTTACKWSYGCGGGTYTSASGVGATSNFASSNLQGVFTMLFGSYFGDWDINNSFLRAPLAQGKTLTNVWSGRPHWAFHHMALGENIGYSAIITQNYQGSLYFPNIYGIHGGWIHTGLMGDPSLRNDVVSPVSNVVATKNGFNCNLTWSATTETNVLGYNIYRKDPGTQTYTKINSTIISGTTYTDNCLLNTGVYKYMVRALKLENTASGTYYNMSEGIADTANSTSAVPLVSAQFLALVNSTSVTCNNTSTNANVYQWTFGDGASSNSFSPSHTYTANGTYTITLIASNACLSDTSDFIISITTVGLEEKTIASQLSVYPNPTRDYLLIKWVNEKQDYESCEAELYNPEGKLVYTGNMKSELCINLKSYNAGLYFLKISDRGKQVYTKKIFIE